MTTDALSRSFSVSPSFRYELSDRSSLSLSYSFSDSFSQSERLAFDVTDPQMQKVDSVNTQIRTNATNSHAAGIAFATAFADSLYKAAMRQKALY